MAEPATPAVPEGQTEETPINSNPAETQAPAPAPAPNMHGFTEDQLADMEKFYNSVGGYEKVKSRLSNPQNYQEPARPAQPTQPAQSAQPAQEPTQPVQSTQPVRPPEGFATLNELNVERYFKDLARDPKYENISKQIEDGSVLKEMAAMGMNPVDADYNINVNQLHQFLALKSASIPTKPANVEPTSTPIVDYSEVGEDIKDMNQALQIVQESIKGKAMGAAPHPAEIKAREYISKNWGKK